MSYQGVLVAKFGGSSLSDAKQFRKVEEIIRADSRRRFVVPSAPGKRSKNDDKITDLLYQCSAEASCGENIDGTFSIIAERYKTIIGELGLSLCPDGELETIHDNICAGMSRDYAASRGEYLNGQILACLLGYEFIDAAEVIFFDEKGKYLAEKTVLTLEKRLGNTQHAVIPGFYGSKPDGSICTFPRNGSDITGAIVARAAGALVYENWTDVSGFMTADPRIVQDPKLIRTITYRELRELSYMGATVLHEDAIFPVSKAGIPINIKNTNCPEDEGTMIVANPAVHTSDSIVTGIAGKKDLTAILLEKERMNAEIGFGRRLLQVFEEHGISFEHMPSGIDTLSVVVANAQLEGKIDSVVRGIYESCAPDSVEIVPGLALIATVGRGMIKTAGTAGRLFGALGRAGVNVRMIDQGSSELNIIVGVDVSDFEKAIGTIYGEFFG